MARRVFLHIGEMKTATSYLQQVGELNTERLAESGLLWVSGGIRYHAVRDLLGHAAKGREHASSTWPLLMRQVDQHDGDVMIVNELLAGARRRSVRRLVKALRHVELHVIITVRDASRSIPSHWQTTIKNGKTVGWTDFAASVCSDRLGVGVDSAGVLTADIESGDESAGEQVAGGDADGAIDREAARVREWFWQRHDVTSILGRWQQAVPPDRITLVTVPPTGSDPEVVVKRIGAVLGVPMNGLEPPEALTNSSLGAHSAELMRRLNLEHPDVTTSQPYGYRSALGGALITTRAGLEPRFALTQEQQDWVRDRAWKMIAGIESSGVRVEGDLADLVPAEHPPAGVVDPADTTEQELLRAASDGLIGMVLNAVELRLEGDELGHQVEALETERTKLLRRVERQQKRIAELVAAERARSATPPSWPMRVRAQLGRNPVVRRALSRLRRPGS